MSYPREYIDYLVQFHACRDYFECHEILEEYWKDREGRRKDSIWLPFIQLAVAQYHHRRNNWPGARKMMSKAIKGFEGRSKMVSDLGLNDDEFFQLLSISLSKIDQREEYESMELPIKDPDLMKICRQECKKHQYSWQKSDLTNHALIHRHRTRDRSEVIHARNNALLKKNIDPK
ncbi:DUF309 domain-containing protein [Falsibacillus pallidus]|uniref:DUF309 domain-containing protein n=1 Tax=Falsibacillus pallidus TaxID=493781 RepID=A0A370GC35_9BACI|nr:DUF309 domain-containing protein [Falsibacillus pallidus]RDI41281.1 hypothetical protein DFR59_109127 [Falsibacillus pallidus]